MSPLMEVLNKTTEFEWYMDIVNADFKTTNFKINK